jgi:S-adenosylmethionine synthetase
MPLPITLAHRLARRLAEVRKTDILDYLRPDGKTQVTVEYIDGRPVRCDTVILSSQHAPEVSQEEIRKGIIEKVINEVIPDGLLDNDTKIFVNPTGRFEIGGPKADSGLTGRKIIVDTYGGYCAHGGGAFSGKDATKVDRSGAYMARYVCKNLVAAGLARKLELQVSYAIGIASPVSYAVNSFGTGIVSDNELIKIIVKNFDFRPRAIIDLFGLTRPIFKPTASYGHFGREEFPWEKINSEGLFSSATRPPVMSSR